MTRSLGALCLLALLSGVACTPVKTWQRSTLSHRCMTPDAQPERAQSRQHMLGAREGTQGANGETGGGCGCN